MGNQQSTLAKPGSAERGPSRSMSPLPGEGKLPKQETLVEVPDGFDGLPLTAATALALASSAPPLGQAWGVEHPDDLPRLRLPECQPKPAPKQSSTRISHSDENIKSESPILPTAEAHGPDESSTRNKDKRKVSNKDRKRKKARKSDESLNQTLPEVSNAEDTQQLRTSCLQAVMKADASTVHQNFLPEKPGHNRHEEEANVESSSKKRQARRKKKSSIAAEEVITTQQLPTPSTAYALPDPEPEGVGTQCEEASQTLEVDETRPSSARGEKRKSHARNSKQRKKRKVDEGGVGGIEGPSSPDIKAMGEEADPKQALAEEVMNNIQNSLPSPLLSPSPKLENEEPVDNVGVELDDPQMENEESSRESSEAEDGSLKGDLLPSVARLRRRSRSRSAQPAQVPLDSSPDAEASPELEDRAQSSPEDPDGVADEEMLYAAAEDVKAEDIEGDEEDVDDSIRMAQIPSTALEAEDSAGGAVEDDRIIYEGDRIEQTQDEDLDMEVGEVDIPMIVSDVPIIASDQTSEPPSAQPHEDDTDSDSITRPISSDDDEDLFENASDRVDSEIPNFGDGDVEEDSREDQDAQLPPNDNNPTSSAPANLGHELGASRGVTLSPRLGAAPKSVLKPSRVSSILPFLKRRSARAVSKAEETDSEGEGDEAVRIVREVVTAQDSPDSQEDEVADTAKGEVPGAPDDNNYDLEPEEVEDLSETELPRYIKHAQTSMTVHPKQNRKKGKQVARPSYFEREQAEQENMTSRQSRKKGKQVAKRPFFEQEEVKENTSSKKSSKKGKQVAKPPQEEITRFYDEVASDDDNDGGVIVASSSRKPGGSRKISAFATPAQQRLSSSQFGSSGKRPRGRPRKSIPSALSSQPKPSSPTPRKRPTMASQMKAEPDGDAAGSSRKSRYQPGGWTQAEVDAMSKAAEDFRETHRKSESEMISMIHGKPPWSEAQGELWNWLKEACPGRDIYEVRHKARSVFHNYVGIGKWTKEQDDELRDMVEKHGEKWAEIGRLINRDQRVVRVRWMSYHRCGGNLKKGRWAEDEEANLIEIVVQVLTAIQAEFGQSAVLINLEAETNINWVYVSERMGFTRNDRQCRDKWKELRDIVKGGTEGEVEEAQASQPPLGNNNLKKLRRITCNDKYALLHSIMASGAGSEKKIPWHKLGDKNFRQKLTQPIRKLVWKRLKESVPNYKRMVVRDIAAYLVRQYEDDLELPDVRDIDFDEEEQSILSATPRKTPNKKLELRKAGRRLLGSQKTVMRRKKSEEDDMNIDSDEWEDKEEASQPAASSQQVDEVPESEDEANQSKSLRSRLAEEDDSESKDEDEDKEEAAASQTSEPPGRGEDDDAGSVDLGSEVPNRGTRSGSIDLSMDNDPDRAHARALPSVEPSTSHEPSPSPTLSFQQLTFNKQKDKKRKRFAQAPASINADTFKKKRPRLPLGGGRTPIRKKYGKNVGKVVVDAIESESEGEKERRRLAMESDEDDDMEDIPARKAGV